MTTKLSINQLFKRDDVQKRFEKLLGEKSAGYISGALQIVNDNKLLAKADPITVLNAVATGAALDLPINKSLGRVWIVPYKGTAQFQIGYKGFVELAQRSGQYLAINAITVHENQFESFNVLTEELAGDFNKAGEGKVVGYAAFFKLLNGFTKTVYWPMSQVTDHAKRFSKAFTSGPWKTDFDAMAKKTVLKHALNNWGPLSTEMQSAVIADQAVQRKEGQFDYDDSPTDALDIDSVDMDKERIRVLKHIKEAKTIDELNEVESMVAEHGLDNEFAESYKTLKDAK